MARDLPSLNALRVFEAAARHASFSRAADELSITQSAVSRQIKLLEEQLGTLLFVRNGPRLSLSPPGEEYARIVRDSLAAIRRGTSRLFGDRSSQTVTLTTVPSLIARWLVPRLGEFERRHPEVSMRLAPSFDLTDFARDLDVDLAVRFGRGHWAGVTARLLVAETLFPVCVPEVARRLKGPEDLARFSLFTEDPNWDLWSYWLEAAGLPPVQQGGKRLSDDYNIQLQAAGLGRGVALGRSLLAADDLRAGRLVCPFDIAVRSPIQYYIVCPPERVGERGIRQTIDWLRETAAATVVGLEAWSGAVVDGSPNELAPGWAKV